MRDRGFPGVALLDYDNDGDLDMYVTNGPGTPNSLLSNQYAQSGQVTFVDVAAAAGVQATAPDSNGVCFADTDNDGDEDIFVVSLAGAHHFFENQGDGSFVDITVSSGVSAGGVGGTSCVFGDVDNDGLVDLFIARAYSLDTLLPCFLHEFTFEFQPNELYVNTGGNIFQDVSTTSGIRDMYDGYPAGMQGLTWSAALVDYDLDGDLDLFNADDQCAALPAKHGGIDRGFIQLWDNDGSGNFTNVTGLSFGDQPFDWMGISFGDFNHDGNMDFFACNFGDWAREFLGEPYTLHDESSVWFFGQNDNTFVRDQAGLPTTPFGWGTSAEDWDNDGDTDVIFHGGLSLGLAAEASNPGSTLINDGTGMFTYDANATSVDHSRRETAGTAAGDLNGDGYVDIVTVSGEDYPSFTPLVPYNAVGVNPPPKP